MRGGLRSLCALNSPRIADRSPSCAAGRAASCRTSSSSRCGLSPEAIKRRVRAGRLHAVHRGVYAVGHAGGRRRRGGGGRRCSRSARTRSSATTAPPTRSGCATSASGMVHVTVRGRGGRERRRRHPHPPPARAARRRGDRAARTADHHARPHVARPRRRGPPRRPLETALDRAEQQQLIDFADAARSCSRATQGAPARVPSMRSYRVPRPGRRPEPTRTAGATSSATPTVCRHRWSTTVIEGRVRDFYWPHSPARRRGRFVSLAPLAVGVERRSRARRRAHLGGIRVLRFTYEQVTKRPRYVIQAVRAHLGRVKARYTSLIRPTSRRRGAELARELAQLALGRRDGGVRLVGRVVGGRGLATRCG